MGPVGARPPAPARAMSLFRRVSTDIAWVEALGYFNVGLFLVFLGVLATWRIPESAELTVHSASSGPGVWTALAEVGPAEVQILERGLGRDVALRFERLGDAEVRGRLIGFQREPGREDDRYRVSVRLDSGTVLPSVPAASVRAHAKVESSTFLQIFSRRTS